MSDSLAFDIAASGMAAQRAYIDVIAENLANSATVRADGEPYRARAPLFETVSPFALALEEATQDDISVRFDDDEATLASGVRLASVVERSGPPRYQFDPAHPLAAKSGPHRGFVALPDVDPIEQMIELVAAGRAYDADVSVLQNAKQMDVEASDIVRL